MYNVMGSAMKSLCFLSLCVLVVNAKRRDRFDIIEKRMGVVESRVSADKELAKDMFVSLQQNFDELNNSMLNFKDQMCPKLHKQRGKEEQTSSTKRAKLLKSSRILVSIGLNREKQWTRDQVEKLTGLVNEQTGLLNQNFSELKNELKDDKEEMESNLEMINAKIDDKIQTKMSKLDEIITNNVKDMREVSAKIDDKFQTKLNKLDAIITNSVKDINEVSAKIDDKFQTKLNKLDEIITNNVKDINKVSLKSDTTEQLISAQQREIEALKETQAKLLNALISANLINLIDFTCPSDWTKFSSYCYLYVDDYKTFSEARAHCKRLGATLPDIENEAENTFIRGLERPYRVMWTGYSDEKEEGTWISERTGQPASFTNFGTGQPDGGTGENCAYMYYNGLWYDERCDFRRYFVCKKDAKMDIKF